MRGESAALRNAVQAQLSVGAVILDVTRVTTIDAGRLGVMLQLREQAQAKGIDPQTRERYETCKPRAGNHTLMGFPGHIRSRGFVDSLAWPAGVLGSTSGLA